MAHYGTLRDFRFDNDADEIRGSTVYGDGDEKLGTIDDVVFDHSTGDVRYAVVDTGGWLSTRRFLVPVDRLETRGDSGQLYIDMRKEQIERLPAYDDESVEDSNRWNDYESRYQQSFTESPILHQEGSTRIITPEVTAGSFTPGEGSGGSRRQIHASELYPDAKGVQPTHMVDNTTRGAQQALAGQGTDDQFGIHRPELSPFDDPVTTTKENRSTGRDMAIVNESVGSSGEPHDAERMRSQHIGGFESSPGGSSRRLMQDDQSEGGRRWRSFQERMRQHRGQLVSRCSACRKDVAA